MPQRPRHDEFEFATLQLERAELNLLLELLEKLRRGEAVQIGPSQLDAFEGLLNVVREEVADFDALQQYRRERPAPAFGEALDPASVPQMPGAREVTPGVFLVPSRSEIALEAQAHATADVAWELVVISGAGYSDIPGFKGEDVLLEEQDGPDEDDTRALLLKWLSVPGTYRVYWRRDDGMETRPVEEYTFTEEDLRPPEDDEREGETVD